MKKFGFILNDGDSYYRRYASGNRNYRSALTQKLKQIVIAQEVMPFEEAWSYVLDLAKRRDDIQVTLLYQKPAPKKSFIKKLMS